MPKRNRIGAPDDIDPAHFDAGQKPKRKRKLKLRDREHLPTYLAGAAVKAADRKERRPATPGVMAEPNDEGGYTFCAPWKDDERWFDLLADAFGTRSIAVTTTFMNHLKGLCSQSFDHDAERWKPSEMEWNAALAIVNATRPRNELEAMFVAQMVAIHWMQIKHAGYQLSRTSGWMDPKDAATTSMLSRTFVQQMSEFRKGRQKPRNNVKQTIVVKRESHHHTHQHVHLEGGGVSNGGQPREPRGYRNGGNETFGGDAGAIEHESCPALPGPNATGNVVPMPRNQGEGALSAPRRPKSGGSTR